MFGFSAFSGAPFSSLGGSPLILTGQQLNISQGTADAEPDAEITGQQINTSLNSVTVTVEINSGVFLGNLLLFLVEFIEVIKDDEDNNGDDESDGDREKKEQLQQSTTANEATFSHKTREEKMNIYDDIDKDFSDVAKLSPKEQMKSLITRKRARTTTT